MRRKRFRPEEIIARLREADVLLGQGERVAEVVKAIEVSEVSSGTSCSLRVQLGVQVLTQPQDYG